MSFFSVSSQMLPPFVTFLSSTQVKVSWDTKNFHKGGPMINYEVKIVYQDKENVHIFYSQANSNSVTIQLDQIPGGKVNFN